MGFSHDMGPFELWDALGVRKTVEAMKAQGIEVAPWVRDMLAAGREFLSSDDGLLSYYDPARKSYITEALDERKVDLRV